MMRWLVVTLALFGAGVAVAVWHPIGLVRPSDPSTAAVRAACRATSRLVTAGRIDDVWESLASDTKAHFRKTHANLKSAIEALGRAASDDQLALHYRRSLEAEYGMTVEQIAASTDRGLWVLRTQQFIRRVPGGAAAFEDLEFRTVESDGSRARVDCRLRDGHAQGFHLLREAGEWKLVDFVPFVPASAWSTCKNQPAAAALR